MAISILYKMQTFLFIFVLMIAIEKYKGIHPGFVLKRELEKRNLKQRPFALSLNEHPQTLNAITKGKRHLNTALALKIEKALGMKEGTLVLLQAYHDIQLERQNSIQKPRIYPKSGKYCSGIPILRNWIGTNNTRPLYEGFLIVAMKRKKRLSKISMAWKKSIRPWPLKTGNRIR